MAAAAPSSNKKRVMTEPFRAILSFSTAVRDDDGASLLREPLVGSSKKLHTTVPY